MITKIVNYYKGGKVEVINNPKNYIIEVSTFIQENEQPDISYYLDVDDDFNIITTKNIDEAIRFVDVGVLENTIDYLSGLPSIDEPFKMTFKKVLYEPNKTFI